MTCVCVWQDWSNWNAERIRLVQEGGLKMDLATPENGYECFDPAPFECGAAAREKNPFEEGGTQVLPVWEACLRKWCMSGMCQLEEGDEGGSLCCADKYLETRRAETGLVELEARGGHVDAEQLVLQNLSPLPVDASHQYWRLLLDKRPRV